MRKLSDKLGEADDRNVLYRADDPARKVKWGPLIAALVLGSVFARSTLAFFGSWFGRGMAIVIVGVGVALFLIGYVVWRRRRNKRLTGSPTKWPDT